MHCRDKKKNQANKSKKKLTIAEALNFESHMQHANPNPNPNTNTNTNANSRSKRATKRQASLFSCYSSAHGFFFSLNSSFFNPISKT